MRVRAFTALTVAAVALAIACSDADTPSTGGGTGGGYAYSGVTGGATSATGGGTGVAPGTGGASSVSDATGGGPAVGTGGAGTPTGGTPGITPTTGGTPGVTPSTGGTSTIAPTTGGTTSVSDTGGTTSVSNTGGNTSSGNTGGSDTGTPDGGNDYSVGEGAFVTACGWSGFAWTGADTLSTIDPADFEGAAADAALCANGSVAAAADWTSYAMLAINVGQGADDDDSADIATDGTGIYVDIENTAGSPLRVQIQDSTGGDDKTHRWCATYTSPGVIPWSDFNTECWVGGEGTAYNGEEINAVMVLVPGDDDTETGFDFCVNKLEPEGSASCTGDSTPDNTGGTGNTGGQSGNSGGSDNNTGGTEDSNCTDDPNPEQPDTSCQQWKDWNNCDQSWMIDGHICDRTCGRCSGSTNTGGNGNTNTGGNGQTGETLPPLQNGTNGFATRYWDCCKPSCGWTANASNPVDSCNINDQNIGVNDNDRNGCDGGTAFTCHSWAPWAVSDTLSYGFAAFNGANCGTCYQIQFSGSSSRGTATPGVAGKQMVVQVTNIGGIEQNQFDILIPGGGVGAMNGCSTQWGASDLGVQYGGWRSSCGADAGCIRGKCQAAFGDDAKLMAGCEWYITWFQMADNPDITYAPIACPAAITAVSGG